MTKIVGNLILVGDSDLSVWGRIRNIRNESVDSNLAFEVWHAPCIIFIIELDLYRGGVFKKG